MKGLKWITNSRCKEKNKYISNRIIIQENVPFLKYIKEPGSCVVIKNFRRNPEVFLLLFTI